MLLKQKKEAGEASVTTVLFDDRVEMIHDRFPIEGVQLNYQTAGNVLSCMRLADYDEAEMDSKIADFLRPVKEHLEEEVASVRKNEKWRLDYMTLQMKYQEKYEQGIEQGKKQMALKMLKNQLPIEEIVLYTDLTIEQVEALEGDLQTT